MDAVTSKYCKTCRAKLLSGAQARSGIHGGAISTSARIKKIALPSESRETGCHWNLLQIVLVIKLWRGCGILPGVFQVCAISHDPWQIIKINLRILGTIICLMCPLCCNLTTRLRVPPSWIKFWLWLWFTCRYIYLSSECMCVILVQNRVFVVSEEF